jgi:hypothetical protein
MTYDREARRRAQAEIDGKFAGLKFLDHVQKWSPVGPLTHGVDSFLGMDCQPCGGESLPFETEQFLFFKERELFDPDDNEDDIKPDEIGETRAADAQPQSTVSPLKVWKGLVDLRIGMRIEFRRFEEAVA